MRRVSGDAAAALLPLMLYSISAYRDVTYWDVGEMDTVPWILGVAHPPGAPAYVLIGWLFSHIFRLGSVAFRMSMLSALAMSVASWAIYRAVYERRGDTVASLCATYVFATGLVVWTRATRAEVHAVETAFLALTLLFTLRWYGTSARGALFAAAASYGVAIAVHPIALLAAPGLLVVVVGRMHESEPLDLARAFGIAAICVGMWYGYLPLRGAYISAHGLDPVSALGLPGGAFWNYDRPETLEGFHALVTGAGVDVGAAFSGLFNAPVMRAGAFEGTLLFLREFGFAAAILVVAGWAFECRRDAWLGAGLSAVAVAGPIFAFGFRDESDAARYVLPACAAGAYFLGVAVERLRARGVFAGYAGTTVCAVTVAVLIVQGRVLFGQPHDVRARTDMNDVLRATPANAILVSTWVLAPVLAYGAYVEGSTGRRTVVPAWYGDTEYVLGRWMRDRPVYVVGRPEGSVEGFRLERVDTRTELYVVLK